MDSTLNSSLSGLTLDFSVNTRRRVAAQREPIVCAQRTGLLRRRSLLEGAEQALFLALGCGFAFAATSFALELLR